ncbi:MAG: porphobilinogen synthase [Peptostreptococcaceae bacterium]|jgi:porphobilinogen synthase|nr:porphobilinogen synthase [Peptostreptococcaceae bacterium]
MNNYLTKRPRRLRKSKLIRDMIAETTLTKRDLIYPIFIVSGNNIKKEIPSMKDCYHYSVDMLEDEIKELLSLGIKSVLLFGIPEHKDEIASSAYDDMGVVQQAIKKIKSITSDIYVITDVCMCAYTSHGHCGILKDDYVQNDETIEYIAKIAVSHAKAGADMVAPSDMMDGRIGKIRQLLDENGYVNTAILSYSAKYASNYYGPFRDAADSAPHSGDRKSYQMDYKNKDEALREVEQDIEQGADMIMVKPALSYMDIIRSVKDKYNMPLVAYSVSGEYTMLKNAVDQGVLSKDVIYETMISIKRAGADIIITYFAKYLATII